MSDLDPKESWVIDSGCTYHMTSRRDWFCTYNEINASQILLGDDNTVEAVGVGSIRLNTNGGTVQVMNNVRYVPNLRRNLISTGTLDKLGFNHKGRDGKIEFYKNGCLAMRGLLKHGLYLLDGNTMKAEVHETEPSRDKTNLWHDRLGHISEKNVKILMSKGMIKKEDVSIPKFCEHCVMGKSKRVSFSLGRHDTSRVLGYVHADIWGAPSVTPSLSKCQYFLSIVNDYSRKVWVMFLKKKDEAFEKFCEWKKLVENQVEKKVKCLRTDNGLEFCNKEFDKFCSVNGIERHRSCPYTPQQNGVAERMNRTLMEKVRCMLNHSGLGEEFWAEATATAAYLINRTPASSIDNGVPEEIWLGKNPGYKHLRVFGSIVYVHVDQGKRKLRALKGVFVGYPPGVKGYKIWLLDQQKCVNTRNVIFQEHTMYKDAAKSDLKDVEVLKEM